MCLGPGAREPGASERGGREPIGTPGPPRRRATPTRDAGEALQLAQFGRGQFRGDRVDRNSCAVLESRA